AVVDHQVAHVVVLDPAVREEVRKALLATPGVAEVLDAEGQAAAGVRHARGGDFIAVADARSWFSYYWWDEGAGDPDYARTVDIHRKPGYDPVELFIDPKVRFPALKVAWFLLKKKLGFRALMEVVSQDASLVRGSHGRIPEDSLDWPVLIGPAGAAAPTQLASTDVYARIVAGF
ncbi:MAG: alkaline phosphatase family protein, partial [Verrucomicrobiota bacterium]